MPPADPANSGEQAARAAGGESPTIDHAQTPADSPRATGEPGRRIGVYRVLETIGEGGMGVIYLAEQTTPVRRRVALKVIKLGMDTRDVVARFEAERQALALMEHPGIAKVFDAGATDDGRPYFAMEHVKGVPINEYCDLHNLTTESRLDLFLQICDAVQHAHQKGVIHRDLKPSNILVGAEGGRPLAKVIDFGVAKATAGRLTERTLHTEQGRFIGTPEYMSPEQAEMTGLNIDTRTDIYSLGAILYELLTGALPFDSRTLRSAGYAEIQRIIRDVEPPRPSTRISTLSSQGRPSDLAPSPARQAAAEGRRRGSNLVREIALRHGADPGSLMRQLRGDLDWITMKAMDKDRMRRYASASELAADIQRHRAHQPVLARPPSALYLMGRFARRRRGVVIAAGLIALALLAGVIGTVTQAVRATGQARRAIAAEHEQSLQREAAEHSANAARREAAKAEAVNVFVREMLGAVDPNRSRGRDVTVRETLDSAALKVEEGAFRAQPDVEAAVRTTIGRMYQELGLYPAAQKHVQAALEINRRVFGDRSAAVAASATNLASLLMDMSDLTGAEALFREALTIRQSILGEDHLDTASSKANLAILLQALGSLDQAESLQREALDTRRKTLSEDHPDVAASLDNLAKLMTSRREYDRAEALLMQSLERRRQALGAEHTLVAASMHNLGTLLWAKGDYAGAREWHEKALAMREKVLPKGHPDISSSLMSLAATLDRAGETDRARELYERSLRLQQERLGDDHLEVATTMHNLGQWLGQSRDFAGSIAMYRSALEIRRKRLGDDHLDVEVTLSDLGVALTNVGDYAAVEPVYRELARIRRKTQGENAAPTIDAMYQLGTALERLRDYAGAEPVLRGTLEAQKRAQPVDQNAAMSTAALLASVMSGQGKHAEAEPLLREVLIFREKTMDPGSWRIASARSLLGEAIAGQGRFEEAEPLILAGHDGMAASKDAQPARKVQALERVVRLYEAWGKPEKAAEWRAKTVSTSPAGSP